MAASGPAAPGECYRPGPLAKNGTEDVRRKSDAKPGDAIILTKPLGVGIYSAAIKKGALSPAGYAEMIATTTLLNRVGAELPKDPAVHAITDVTGFGLLGHGLEMARNSTLTLVVRPGDLPLMSEAATLAQQGFVTGASIRNWASYGVHVSLPAGFPDWKRHLLTDPQTSGGLLISCAPEKADLVVQTIVAAGYPAARAIGRMEAGMPGIRVDGA
jgi:selenide,water dikinase